MARKMYAGNLFLGGDYAQRIARGELELPDEAITGTYALGTVIMVNRDSLREQYRLAGLPQWFQARVCLPPPVPGQWYRWYDPFIWYEAEFPIHEESDNAPANMSYVGKLWNPRYKPESRDKWAYPIGVWKELFGKENE